MDKIEHPDELNFCFEFVQIQDVCVVSTTLVFVPLETLP
jgi:hypothetical protein